MPISTKAVSGSLDFAALYRQMPVPAAVIDENFCFVEINEEFQSQFELSQSEVVGRSNVLMYDVGSAEAQRRTRLHATLSRGPISDDVRRVITGSGRQLEVNIRFTRIDDGDRHFYLVLYQNVRAFSEHTKHQISRADVFRLAIEQSPVPTAIQDADFRVILINKAACDFLGYPAEKLMGIDPREWSTPKSSSKAADDRAGYRAEVRKGGFRRAEGFREAVHGVTGEIIPYRIDVGRTETFDGAEMWFTMMFDMRPTQQLKGRLRAQISYADRGFDHAPVGMVLTNVDGGLVRANKTLSKITGLNEPADLEALAHRIHAETAASRDTAKQGAEQHSSRFRIQHGSNGEAVWLETHSAQLKSAQGEHLTLTAISDATDEQQLKSELSSSLLRQSALLRSMDAGLAHVVGEIVVQVNPALAELLGKTEQQLLGQPIEVLFGSPADWLAIEPAAMAALASDGFYRTAQKIVHSDGRTRRCEFALRRIDAERSDLGILITLTGVNDLLEQSDQLRQGVQDLRGHRDTKTVGVVTLHDGKVAQANRAMINLLGRPEAQVIGQDFVGFCDASPELDIARQFNPQDGDKTETVLRLSLVTADMAFVDCLVHITPVAGDPRHAVTVVAVDLRQRNAALSLAVRMQLRFDAFASSIDEAIIVVSPSGDRIIHANETAEGIFGLPPGELVRLSSARLWHRVVDADMADLDSSLATLASGKSSTVVVRMKHADRDELTVRLRMFGGAAGLPERYILAEDISSERKRERVRLEQAIAQRETLVREVHHRIKNNLQGVAGLLQQSAVRQPELSPILSDVAAQIHAIAQVHGLQFRTDKALRPGEIVTSIADNLRINFGQRLSCEETGSNEPIWIIPEGEAVPLALVFNELMTNAFKHCTDEKDVSINVSSNRDGVLIQVANTGQLPPAFDVDNLPLTSSGLGLVKALIPRRGTRLTFEQQGDQVLVSLGLTSPALRVFEESADLAQSTDAGGSTVEQNDNSVSPTDPLVRPGDQSQPVRPRDAANC